MSLTSSDDNVILGLAAVCFVVTLISRAGRKRRTGQPHAPSPRSPEATSLGKVVSPVDRVAFDERIRQQPAEHTAVRSYTAQQLRDATVWREILGPPVSPRQESRD